MSLESKIFIVLGIVGLLVSYGAWIVGRKINYSLGYESQVESTVKAMVKSECLNKEK